MIRYTNRRPGLHCREKPAKTLWTHGPRASGLNVDSRCRCSCVGLLVLKDDVIEQASRRAEYMIGENSPSGGGRAAGVEDRCGLTPCGSSRSGCRTSAAFMGLVIEPFWATDALRTEPGSQLCMSHPNHTPNRRMTTTTGARRNPSGGSAWRTWAFRIPRRGSQPGAEQPRHANQAQRGQAATGAPDAARGTRRSDNRSREPRRRRLAPAGAPRQSTMNR